MKKVSRKARSEQLLKAFIKSRNARIKRARKYFLREKRRLRSSGQPLYSSSSDSHLSVLMASLSTSGHSADSISDTSSEDSHNSQDTNSSQTSDDLEEDVALMELDEALEIMPELVDMDVRLFDEDKDGLESEDDSDESDESDNDSGNDADDEEAWVDEVLESYCRPSVAKRVRKYIEDMYST